MHGGIEYVRGTIIGEQCPRYRVQFWTKLKYPLTNLSHRIGREWYYFHDIPEAKDWFRENAEHLKKADTAPDLWGEIEVHYWDMAAQGE